MLDVMHFLMEEDITPATREQYEARSRFRASIYPDFYKMPYALDPTKSSPKELEQMPLEPPMDDGTFPKPIPQGIGQTVPQLPPQPIPQVVPSHGNMAPDSGGRHPVRTLTPGGRQLHAVPEGRGMAHKPYIPPTDENIVDDPFHPFSNLRETPLF